MPLGIVYSLHQRSCRAYRECILTKQNNAKLHQTNWLIYQQSMTRVLSNKRSQQKLLRFLGQRYKTKSSLSFQTILHLWLWYDHVSYRCVNAEVIYISPSIHVLPQLNLLRRVFASSSHLQHVHSGKEMFSTVLMPRRNEGTPHFTWRCFLIITQSPSGTCSPGRGVQSCDLDHALNS